MPWTFAHPAAVLPFRRIGAVALPLSGLVVGSLVPDFGYYAGHFEIATRAHTASGLLLICLPTALLLVVILRRFRGWLLAPLPDPHRTLLEGVSVPPLGSPTHLFAMAIAILVGAITHLAWDAFTHANGAMVLACAPLREPLFVFAGRRFAVYNVLQHASTVLGLAAMAVAYCRWLSRSVKHGHAKWGPLRHYVPLAMAGVVSGVSGLTTAWLLVGSTGTYSVVLVRGVIHATIVFIVAYGLLALHAAACRARRAS